MALSISTAASSSSRPNFFFIFIILLLSHGSIAAADVDNKRKEVNIGAIVDANSRIGKEQKAAMEIAIRDFNNASNNNAYNLVLHVRDSSSDPLRAANAADDLIKDLETQAIVGIGTWQEAALVADVGNQAQVPVLSMATAAVIPPLTYVHNPFFVRMANNDSLQMRCVAAIVGSYKWGKVITIYEDGAYGGDSGMNALLSDALRDEGSEIEYQLALPPFSSLSNPKSIIKEELEKLKSKQCRVFIVLHSSLPLATHLFIEAKQMGIMGKGSVWITTDTVTSLLDSVNSSTSYSMQGVLGIKPYFSETSASFRDFYFKFRQIFKLEYAEEDKAEPGIYALRAFDTISTVAQAIERLTNNSTSKTLLENILSSDFNGLSGKIQFKDGELSHSPTYRIINVIGNGYKDIGFWSPKFGFSDEEAGGNGIIGTMNELDSSVDWPGGLRRVPRGWTKLSDAIPIKIGVPGNAKFKKFVKVEHTEVLKGVNQSSVSGFCISVFDEAVKLLNYDLQYEFEPYSEGNYDELVNKVYKKEFDAVVGDVTILANRSKYVEFTVPYAKSGLSMVVPVKNSKTAWMFMKPFTPTMWLATGTIFVYTMFIVWFLEHGSNPNFRGPWMSQLGNTLWFSFSTLFFAHRETLYRNYTRIVVLVWLFAVLVLTSSYTASLTSILTVPPLEPTVPSIDSLRNNNLKFGCHIDSSFVKTYLESVSGLDLKNIIDIKSEENYLEEFRKGTIAAAFLEIPYERVFLSKYCKEYTVAERPIRFGGFGFVFPKGSPLATDISEAILILSENGMLTQLEDNWFPLSYECSNSGTDTEDKSLSLSLNSFWGIYIITGGTSTIVFLLFLVHLLWESRRHHEDYEGKKSPMDRLRKYFHDGQLHFPEQALTSEQAVDVDVASSSGEGFVYVSGYNSPSPGHVQASLQAEIEMPERSTPYLDARTHASFRV